MPELPEVETVRSALERYLCGHNIHSLRGRDGRLRWPVPEVQLQKLVVGQRIERITRRAKYLLIHILLLYDLLY